MAGRGQRGRGRGQFFQSRQQPPESKSGRGGRGFPPGRVEPSRRPLDFIGLQKLAEDSTEPAVVVRRFNSEEYGLGALLDEHKTDLDYLEFIFVVLGNFCRKNGSTQFTEGFVEIVRTLGEREIFQQIASVVMHLPNSRAKTFTTKTERLKLLITGLYHLSVETLVLMPSFACTFLGRNFYQDLLILKDMPSIKALNLKEPIFDVLLEGVPRLKDAWNQHFTVEKKQDDEEIQYEERVRRQVRDELTKLQKPPNDFRKMSVMPNWDDLHMEGHPFLRPNIVEGHYPDAETYLDVQFRLMREDFVQPLRAGIQEYMKQADRKQQRFRVDNVKFYYGVTVTSSEDDLKRNQYTLQFSLEGLHGINWEGSKRLMTGSLLCLTRDRFNTITFFTVAFRDPRQLSHGKISARYEGGPLPGRRSCETFLMAESAVYFEAYRSVLMALQRISPVHLPLADFLLGKFNQLAEPDYLVGQEPIYDFSSVPTVLTYTKTTSEVEDQKETPNAEEHSDDEELLTRKNSKLRTIQLRNVENFPSTQELNLDASQREALLTALTRKVAVIQGPPGTGKTYLGLKIVQVLLDNRQYWNGPTEEPINEFERRRGRLAQVLRPRFTRPVDHVPILVICYTNHALDQFLEGIMAFTRKIVRIGGQSKCKALEPFMLKEWSKRRGGAALYGCRDWIRDVRNKLDAVDEELTTMQQLYKTVDKFGIVHEDSLRNLNILPTNFHAKLMNWRKNRRQQQTDFPALVAWLGIHPYGITDSKLEQIKNEFNRLPVVQPKPVAVVNNEQEQVDADDQWEREDIEAIQGQRVVVGDDFDDVPRDQQVPKETVKIPDRFGLQFGIKTSTLMTTKREMENDLPSAKPAEQEFIKYKTNELQLQVVIITRLLETVPPLNAAQLRAVCNGDLNAVPLSDRWAAYNTWKMELLDQIGQKERKLEADYHKCQNELAEVRTKERAEICRPADIVGFTTSGAAKQRALIGHLKPNIVIVEEAAQVLESSCCNSLVRFLPAFDPDWISNNEYQDFIDEIERLDLIRAYYLLLCSPYYSTRCIVAPKLMIIKRNLIDNVTKLDDARKTETVKELEETAKILKSPLGISKEEREQIVKAMGMTRGHWFKCPIGHVYAIGDCGGAVMESTCNECGARIGGGSHRLRGDNGVATEMDGATRGAFVVLGMRVAIFMSKYILLPTHQGLSIGVTTRSGRHVHAIHLTSSGPSNIKTIREEGSSEHFPPLTTNAICN